MAALAICTTALADEGMWLLPLLQKLNKKDLKEAGCKLTPKDIYDVNHSSLKDAIVHFGGGCTGEIISAEGLLVTNHHCGYSSIQGLSTEEHNYLMDGYWAKTRAEEIPCPGLTVTFLVSMTDVTGVAEKDGLTEQAVAQNPGCDAELVTFYDGNAEYLLVTRTYSDVRFVGAPPASMGKFGGETDNWMWPRHTCDFSMFRVYAGPDGQPAPYHKDNVPYQSPRSLKISLKGVQEGDYTMVIGYPGRTQRYQTAAQLQNMLANNRVRIDARTVRQDVMWKYMIKDPAIQLKYADKYASSANGWKKWQGEELAFDKLSIIPRQLSKEAALKAWIDASEERVAAYGDPVSVIAERVAAKSADEVALNKLFDGPFRIELTGFASSLMSLYGRALNQGQDSTAALEEARSQILEEYRDYVPELDRDVAVALLEHYRKVAAPEDALPIEGWDTLDIPAFVDRLFESSVYVSPEKLGAATPEQLLTDPAAELSSQMITVILGHYMSLYGGEDSVYDDARKAYTAALMEWRGNQAMYPDANSTMRLTFGHVLP